MIRDKCLAHMCFLLSAVLMLVIPASAEWNEKVLYSFQGLDKGSTPVGGVVFDRRGNLYVATTDGGPASCAPIGSACGTVYQLSPPAKDADPWTATLIRRFKGKRSNDASVPTGGLILDATGNLYGVTGYGGTGNCVLLGVPAGCGTVYELSPPAETGGLWTETILYSFPTAKQGYLPNGNLVFDSAGNLYGATTFGGGKGTTCDEFYGGNCGAAFELSPPKQKGGNWTEKVLHAFSGGTDGANPNGGLALDSMGDIFGTTAFGGSSDCQGPGCGTIFKLTTPKKADGAWTEKMLHIFTDGNDGAGPNGGLFLDTKGRLYGAAGGGGSARFGVVFRLSLAGAEWTEAVLHAFTDNEHGRNPVGPLSPDSSGGFYGTALVGPNGRGIVFHLALPKTNIADWAFSILYAFKAAPDAAGPEARLTPDGAGALYSTTVGGGAAGYGTVFELKPQ
ncbi:MAG: choice-of-anchor tandem repeat GloVer-containing protein [Terriglobales bacterium]